MTPTIGTLAGGAPLGIDLERLVAGRALLTANSGAGKSWALRRILEQTHGSIQQLVIDPEGEFYTLRERFDYVLAGRGGDCAAEPRSAALLARRLLELGVSAILDLYELAPRDRVRFVRAFVEALVDAPKALWHPVLVVVDEAHTFAPEKGHGEAESTEAIARLMAQGRKRGFAGVLATQRLGKLAKDVAAEANNLLVGRATLDVDLRRCADALGMTKAEWPRIRSLRPGHFFAFGPALCAGVDEVLVGTIETSHPRAGATAAPPAPPRAAVQRVLAELADLPAEAEAEARSVEQLRAAIAERDRTIRSLERDMAAGVAAKVVADPEAGRRAKAAAAEITRLRKALESAMQFIVKINAEQFFQIAGESVDREAVQKALDAAGASIAKLVEQKLDGRKAQIEKLQREAERIVEALKRAVSDDVTVDLTVRHNEPFTVRPAPTPPARSRFATAPAGTVAEGLTGPEQRVLDALAWWASIGVDAPTKIQVGFVSGYRVGKSVGGTFGNLLGKLRAREMLDYPTSHAASLLDEGRKVARAPSETPTTEALHDAIRSRLDGPETRVFDALIAAYPNPLTKQDAGARAGYTVGPSVGGTFGNILGRLRSLGLIDYPSSGTVVALPVLFLEG